MTAARVALAVFVASIFQVAVFSGWTVAGGYPDLLLVTVVSIGLLRGARTRASAPCSASVTAPASRATTTASPQL